MSNSSISNDMRSPGKNKTNSKYDVKIKSIPTSPTSSRGSKLLKKKKSLKKNSFRNESSYNFQGFKALNRGGDKKSKKRNSFSNPSSPFSKTSSSSKNKYFNKKKSSSNMSSYYSGDDDSDDSDESDESEEDEEEMLHRQHFKKVRGHLYGDLELEGPLAMLSVVPQQCEPGDVCDV